jgi:uncharacterized phiE125 gp8 family phage protein
MNPYTLKLVEPGAEPVTLDDCKYHLQLVADDQDAYIEDFLIPAARRGVEHILGRPIGDQTFELGLPCWPACHIELPRSPLIDLVSIKYTTSDDEEITLVDVESSPVVTSDIYTLETASEPGMVILKANESWPSDTLANGYPIKIRFRAGLEDVSRNIQMAVLLTVAHYFSHRELVTSAEGSVRALTAAEIPAGVYFLLDADRYQEFR